MNSDDLKKRTKEYALEIIKIVDALPNTMVGRTIGNQLVRSGTAVAANYRAALRSRSKAEFISKLSIVIEESDESTFWIEMIIESKLLNSEFVQTILKETDELTAIFYSTKKSTMANRK